MHDDQKNLQKRVVTIDGSDPSKIEKGKLIIKEIENNMAEAERIRAFHFRPLRLKQAREHYDKAAHGYLELLTGGYLEKDEVEHVGERYLEALDRYRKTSDEINQYYRKQNKND